MARFFPLISLVFAAASPVLAAEERATINVSLKVEPFCAVRPPLRGTRRAPAAAIDCSPDPARSRGEQERAPPYTVRTIRTAGGTVISLDF